MTRRISRRALLGAAAVLPMAGCAEDAPAPPRRSTSSTRTTPPMITENEGLAELERRFDARLGVYAVDTGSGAAIGHRFDERFAFCSTFKALAAAAVLHRNPMSHVDTLVTYTDADLLPNARITPDHVATGMTIGQLCDAAVRYSDGTAGNLLLRDLGGPAELTAYLRELGDRVSRMDRIEPDITTAVPGDPRDTTTPHAFGTDYQRLVLGDALPADKRAFLVDLLVRNKTGDNRIRAGVPAGWRVADKTGTGDYATANDFAIAWPPTGAPLTIAIMSSKSTVDAEYDEAIIAEVARYAVTTLGRG